MTVDVAQVERKLRALWPSDDEHVTRASLFNLVAYCESEPSRDQAAQIISDITERLPCRAILVLALPAAAAELTATVSAHCHLAGGGRKQVCCEQITLVAAGDRVGQVASAVLPLLEADLPVVLWWRGNFLEQPAVFGPLSAAADRVIFDSSAWPALAAHVEERPRCQFTDLSWTRLVLWRKLTADCFDDAAARVALAGMRRLTVTHGGGGGARWRAWLYAGWVATQLGWSPEDAAARVSLGCREEADATAVGLLAVELSGDGATVRIQKDFDDWAATAVVTMPAACGLPHKQAFAPVSEAAMLEQELEHPARHAVYERALTMAAWLAAAQA